MTDWGGVYYDHYSRFFGDPAGRKVYVQSGDTPSIQVLFYDNVYQGCRVFCSLGVTHYEKALSRVSEVCLVSDSDWEGCPEVFANILFYIVQKKIKIGWGVAVGGIENVDSSFFLRHKKSAFYLTNPYIMPEGFNRIVSPSSENVGFVYWGFFITEPEYRFFKENGGDLFESLLQDKEVDPFCIDRITSVDDR